MNTLKKWWPAILPAAVAAYHTALPQIQIWVSHHPSAAVYIASGTVFVTSLLRSPVAQGTTSDPTAK